jgi:hypothetical protein
VLADIMLVFRYIETQGMVPTKACDHAGVSYATFDKYTKQYAELGRLRKDAEDRLYERMADALPHIDTDYQYGQSDAKMASVVSGNIKWLLARRRRDAYGDHSTIEHKVTAEREILDALQHAKARAHGHAIAIAASTPTSGHSDLVIDMVVDEAGLALTKEDIERAEIGL